MPANVFHICATCAISTDVVLCICQQSRLKKFALDVNAYNMLLKTVVCAIMKLYLAELFHTSLCIFMMTIGRAVVLGSTKASKHLVAHNHL